jgi:hypothetical protein
MVSIKAFEKLLVEPKTLGLGTLKEKILKFFQKPWGSIYFIEIFSKRFWNKKSW